MKPVSLVFVCDHAELLAGCGSCRVGPDVLDTREDGTFREVRRHQETMGRLLRVVHRFFAEALRTGRLRVDVVDPRNQLYLVPKLIRDVWTHRPGLGAGLRTLCQAFAVPAVVLNGRIVRFPTGEPEPDHLCHLLLETLGDMPAEIATDSLPR